MSKGKKFLLLILIALILVNVTLLFATNNIVNNLVLFVLIFIDVLILLLTSKVNKGLKLIISLIILTICAWFTMMIIDFEKALVNEEPMFINEVSEDVYEGFGYKIIYQITQVENEEFPINGGVEIYLFDRFVLGWIE